MAKRRPGSQLTQDNWDEEDEPDHGGEFRKADDKELQNRVRKVARRRINTGGGGGGAAESTVPINGTSKDATDNEPPKTNIFSNFGGFVKSDKPAANSSPFSFLANTKPAASSATTTSAPTSAITATTTTTTTTAAASAKSQSSDDNSDYYAKLKGLNQNLSAWITKHVNENPICILTPIFDDYAKHLKTIQTCNERKQTTEPTDPVKPTKSIETSSINFGFGAPKTGNDLKPQPSFSSTASTFSFGSSASTLSGTSSGFSFISGQQPFTFNIAPPVTDAAGKTVTDSVKQHTETENEDEPPKVEFTPVVEEDSLYSKRCKVYVKADTNYKERGVGMLYIKSVEDGKKVQLLVRADTNLGNILLNILLNDAVPAKRMGKNDVMLICIPTPESKPPPTTVLIRVKTAADADDLLKQIEAHKK